jgi:hypothetical protein
MAFADPLQARVVWPADRKRVPFEETTRGSWSRPFVMSLHYGLGAPAGLIGLAYEAAPTSTFPIEIAAGGGAFGPQVSIGARLRVPLSGSIALSLEGGLSSGAYDRDGDACDFWPWICPVNDVGWRREWDHAVWARGAPNAEGRWLNLQWRAYVGLQALTNPWSATCISESDFGNPRCSSKTVVLPFIGGSVGLVFGSAD